MRRPIIALGMVALMVSCVATARADYYDDFGDGWWERDPNDPAFDSNDPYWTDPNNAVLFDRDNPDWDILDVLAADQLAQIVSDTVADKALRLSCDRIFVYPIGAMAAGVVTYDRDPNTSLTWRDDTTNHYVLTWVYYTGYYHPDDPNPNKRYSYNDPNYDPNYDDPNDDKGRAMILMHADEAIWTGLVFAIDFDSQTGTNPSDEWPHSYHANLQAFNFSGIPPSAIFRRIWIEPNDTRWSTYPNLPYGYNGCPHVRPDNETINPYNGPNFAGQNIDIWERTGFWMLLQFEQDPNYASGDPNGKFLRGAIWHGDKYAWDGKYIMEGELSTSGASGWSEDWYFPEGGAFVLASSDDDWTNGFPADVAYDNFEVRTGVFTNQARQLLLKLNAAGRGTVDVDPALLDPNDPNTDLERLYRYTDGTEVVLVATPAEERSFKQWVIYDPNYPGDFDHATIDTNTVLQLTMDQDHEIRAEFNCGSGVPPFVAMSLLALGAGCMLRRLR